MTAAAEAIAVVFIVLLVVSNVAVTYLRSRRAIENMRAVDAERKARLL